MGEHSGRGESTGRRVQGGAPYPPGEGQTSRCFCNRQHTLCVCPRLGTARRCCSPRTG
ncbi:hypothetical protein BU14_2733s0001 [Porphyra umbilicalis]|uniref:Uncharacterized protein n=1 Tax=Porphyra umbilicalis TaxID=2786 RepID=A0A1X6NJ51_PORUM|nr:hypothetical protein BU14_2733s0001 [Porphyra umbilicalis]|eukprot:OSX68476.1 hypothetical protein BU14_2733s0001 [Porphyra umbilicalis]